MSLIPPGEYAPDRSDFDGTVSDTITNVLPTVNGYGPLKNITALSSALASAPKGAIMARADDGTVNIYVGTTTKIYKFNTATLGWTDLSGATTFAVPTDAYWSTAQFGDHVIFTNKTDGPYVVDMSAGGNFAALGGSPPASAIAGVVGDFLFLGEASAQSRKVTWSGLNNDAWWTALQKSSDSQVFADGDNVTGIVGYEKGGLIVQRSCIREITAALDTPMIFTFQKTEYNRGGIASGAILSSGRDVFYLSLDGFNKYGVPSVLIGERRVNETFLADIDPLYMTLVQGAVDPKEHICYWRYKSTATASTTVTDKLLIYHYDLDRWTIANLSLSWIFPAASPGYTLDTLDTLGYTLDTLPFSLDSSIWTAGTPLLAGFTSDYKLGFFQGSALEGTMQTADIELNEGKRSFVNGFTPVCDADSIYGRVAAKDRHGKARTWGTEAAVIEETGLIPCGSSGKLHRFEVRIPSAETWTNFHGVELTEDDAGVEGKQ